MLNKYLGNAMEAARNGNREVFLTQRLIFLKYFEMEADDGMPNDLKVLYESCIERALGSVNVLSMRKKWLTEAEEIHKKILRYEL